MTESQTLQIRSLRMMAEAHRLMAESLRLSGLVDGASIHRKRAIECDRGADDVERVCKTAAQRQNTVDSGMGKG